MPRAPRGFEQALTLVLGRANLPESPTEARREASKLVSWRRVYDREKYEAELERLTDLGRMVPLYMCDKILLLDSREALEYREESDSGE